MTVVVDASFSGSWILPDEHSSDAEGVLEAALQGQQVLAVPDLWVYEMINLVLAAGRRGRIEMDQMLAAARLIEQIPVERYDHQSQLILERLIRLASKFSLAAYDAAYLELADRLQCPLRSRDGRLGAAAQALGLV